ncbi:competence/damage-inducible protein CinA [Desulfurispirillum indicum S5]|uniref:CinA-like protein n=1 Tax=Desulfurispirillum indicum (strain ATCC BAA-1389 / DSM 22839 / S5) TaxID=653733 RepID=E6W1J5_DESIS|nr:CinA family nicotinamide mononucleotide deamidase-related protein [Desulfurispirillum indicum]ADU66544.1 competence/damage-inducible protein CinA [Desulfurispirillum indicum S5]
MRASLLSIGDELLSGFILNSNARYLAQMLTQQGFDVRTHLTVGDETDDIVTAYHELAADNQLVLVTGGLGPTHDDKTQEASARALGVESRIDEASLSRLQEFFTRRKRPMKDIHKRMATFPVGATVVPNPVGAADGFTFMLSGCQFLCMPGVPAEMRAVSGNFMEHFLQYPQERFYNGQAIISLCGIPESEVARRIAHLLEGEDYRIGLLPNDAAVRIRVASRTRAGQQEADRIAASVMELILPCFAPEDIFSMENEVLEVVLLKELQRQQLSLALAESCTGGKIADQLIAVPGASATLLFGGVFYSNQSKVELLGVAEQTLVDHGAVSEPTAREMVDGVCRIARTHCGISVTGIAGPEGGTEEKPVGTVYIGTRVKDCVEVQRYLHSGNRELIRQRAVQAGLFQLLRMVRR